jgi:hypothetical protein
MTTLPFSEFKTAHLQYIQAESMQKLFAGHDCVKTHSRIDCR